MLSCRILEKHLIWQMKRTFKVRDSAAATAAAAVRGWSHDRTFCGTWRSGRPAVREATDTHVVDLRTDALGQPAPEMLQYMVTENVKNEELEGIAADMFQMEAALFVPSATMSNLIAVMAHCRERGDEMLVGDLSHMHVLEQGGSAQLAGVYPNILHTLSDGTFDLDEIESRIRHAYPESYSTRSRLICLENTHNILGGRVLPLTFLQEVRHLADRYNMLVHMDGARVMNAAVALGVSPATILQYTHSVSVSLSKGLGAPFGTVLAGARDFISQAVRCRKALGGEIQEVGILSAAGKLSLEKLGRLEEDHRNARTFAKGLLDCDPPLFAVDMDSVQTNIVRFHLKDPSLRISDFCARMAQVGEAEEAALGQRIQILAFFHYGNFIRVVWHLGVSAEDTQLAIRKMQYLATECMK